MVSLVIAARNHQQNLEVCAVVNKNVRIAAATIKATLNVTNADLRSTGIYSNLNYRSQASDTNMEADIYLFIRLRQLSLTQRLEMFMAHERGVKKLCLTGIKFRHRGASVEKIRHEFIRAVLAERFRVDFQPQGNGQ